MWKLIPLKFIFLFLMTLPPNIFLFSLLLCGLVKTSCLCMTLSHAPYFPQTNKKSQRGFSFTAVRHTVNTACTKNNSKQENVCHCGTMHPVSISFQLWVFCIKQNINKSPGKTFFPKSYSMNISL